jgi:hypothetical protein
MTDKRTNRCTHIPDGQTDMQIFMQRDGFYFIVEIYRYLRYTIIILPPLPDIYRICQLAALKVKK